MSAARVMIYSPRKGGYRRGGVQYTREPRAYAVVDDRPGESDAQALARRKRGTLSASELEGIQGLIEAAEAAGQEPALSLVDGVAEGSALDRANEEKRAQAAALDERVRAAEVQLRTAEAEVKAAKDAAAEAAAELADVRDRAEAATNALKLAEQQLGEMQALKDENARLKAQLVQAERKRK